MSNLTFKQNPIQTQGQFPVSGTQAPDFKLIGSDLKEVTLANFEGKNIILNIFPSIDTPVCALQLTKFSQKASTLDNTILLFASLDLPFAFKRFCSTEGITNAVTASDFRYRSLATTYGITMQDGPLAGLYARAVLILNKSHQIIYSELVKEVTDEPNYDDAMAAIQ